ncbi:MAG: hypothetical protein KKC03_14045 [Bacteroidetes bacterium]|nr:hypothetical protein [Bacteroidota bacterium]
MMANKLILSAGYGCDMTFFDETPDGEAFIHHVNEQWLFDKKVYWSWMRPIANAGANLHRIFLYCVGGERLRSECFMPWEFVFERDAWDLRIKNQVFFDILRQQVIEANKMKLRIMVCVMNECEERKADRREQSPFYHNVNGVTGMYDRKALPFVSALTDWITEALAGTDYGIEFINEGHRRKSGSVEAVEAMLPKLLAADVKPWNISLGADVIDYTYTHPDVDFRERWPNELHPPDFENYDLFMNRLVKVYDKKYPNATHEAFYVSHSFAEGAPMDYGKGRPYGARTDYTKTVWVDRNLASNRICFSTDGAKNADLPGGRPSAARMKAAMLYVMQSNPRYKATPLIDGKPKLWFDYLPNHQTTAQIVEVVQAMAEAKKQFFGDWPENWGNVPTYEEMYPEPEPPIPPEPPGPEPLPEINITWQGWLGLVVIFIVVVLAIMC